MGNEINKIQFNIRFFLLGIAYYLQIFINYKYWAFVKIFKGPRDLESLLFLIFNFMILLSGELIMMIDSINKT